MTEQSSEKETDESLSTRREVTAVLPYTPDFREGAWFYGALVGAFRANGKLFPGDWLYPELRRRIRTSASGITERFLPEVMEVLSPDPDTDRVLQLREGSLFGFYEHGLSRPIAARWRDRLLQGLETSGTHPIRALRGFSGAVNGHVRWCPTCRREDEAQGRISVWLTLHQIPYVHHCLEHGDLLVYRCAQCRNVLDRGWQRRLPSDVCSICGSAEFEGDPTEDEPGYEGLLGLVRLMIAEAINVRSTSWLATCRRQLGYPSSGVLAKLNGTLWERWPSRREGRNADGTPTWASFESAAAETSLRQRLILTDALLHAGLATPSDFNSDDDSLARTGREPDDLKAEVRVLLARFEIDEGAADDLLSGLPHRAICTKYKVSMRRLYQCLDEASPSVRKRINAHRAK